MSAALRQQNIQLESLHQSTVSSSLPSRTSKRISKKSQQSKKRIQDPQSARLPSHSSTAQPKTKSFKTVTLSQRTLSEVRNGLASPNTRARFIKISMLVDAVEEAKENRRFSDICAIPDPNNMQKQTSLSLSSSLKRQIDVLSERSPSGLNENSSIDLGSRFRVRRLQKDQMQEKIGSKTTVVYTF